MADRMSIQVNTLTSEGWTSEVIELDEQATARIRASQDAAQEAIDRGDIAPWCECTGDHGEGTVMSPSAVPFDLRTDEPQPDWLARQGASHGVACSHCGGTIQTG